MTQLRVAGGASHYLAVLRNCSGESVAEADGSSYDIGIGVDHKFGGEQFIVGVNAGYLHDQIEASSSFATGDRGYYFVNPTIGIVNRRFSVTAGPAFFSKELIKPNDMDVSPTGSELLLSAAIRAGDLKGFYLTASALSGLPTYSGAGYFDIGGGWTLSERGSLWVGIALWGLTATAFETRLQWRLGDRFYTDLGSTIGGREGERQYSLNLGLTYRVIR